MPILLLHVDLPQSPPLRFRVAPVPPDRGWLITTSCTSSFNRRPAESKRQCEPAESVRSRAFADAACRDETASEASDWRSLARALPALRPAPCPRRAARYNPRRVALHVGDRLGPYEVAGPLGSGGMGEVYRARDPRLGREVAIKVLPTAFRADPDRLRRFEQEARATAALNHPNILAVYDVGTEEGRAYLVTELVEGT